MVSNKSNNETNSTDLVFHSVLSLLEKGNWSGTMTQLGNILRKNLSRETRKVLPRSSSALRLTLNRVVSRIRNQGVSVKFVRSSDSTRTRLVKFVVNS
jgi:hypothetical protein